MSDFADEGLRAEDWAGEMGRNWLANLAGFESMIAPMGAALLDHAAFKPREHVIDIGCGGGAITIAIGRSVSPGGSATGLDISRDLIDSCGIRASQGTSSQVYWVCADAARIIPAGAPFDRMVSRFGSMFFPDAKAAFRNLRKMLKTGGRIDLAVWAAPDENPWMTMMMTVVARHMPPADPAAAPDPHAPGPFAFADTAYMTQVLEQAGFGDIAIEPCVRDLAVGGAGATPRAAAEFILSAMHFAQAIGEDQHEAAIADIAQALEPHHVPGKGNLLPGKAWIVTARAI